MSTKYKVFKTRSGLKYALNEDLYSSVICNDEKGETLDLFETFLLAGEYFPQINRFIAMVILFLSGNASIVSLLIVNLIVGIASELLWNHSSLYKLRPLSMFYMLLGQTVFKWCIHIVIIICLAIFISNNWLLALFSIIFGILTNIIGAFVSGYNNTYKHNNNMANYAINIFSCNTEVAHNCPIKSNPTKPKIQKTSKVDPDTPLKAREYINALKTHEEWHDPTDEFKCIISTLIFEENIHRKTDLLLDALDNINELFNEIKSAPSYTVGSANLCAVVFLRIYLDCVLLHCNDWDTVNEQYIMFKTTGLINRSAHKYINLMVIISNLLDRAIVYLFEHLDTVSTDYYLIVERNIHKYLNEYTDDNTDWNKI